MQGAPAQGRHLLSLLSSDSSIVYMTRDPSNVCLITEPGMFHPVSHVIEKIHSIIGDITLDDLKELLGWIDEETS